MEREPYHTTDSTPCCSLICAVAADLTASANANMFSEGFCDGMVMEFPCVLRIRLPRLDVTRGEYLDSVSLVSVSKKPVVETVEQPEFFNAGTKTRVLLAVNQVCSSNHPELFEC
jgi:hypothetical protein